MTAENEITEGDRVWRRVKYAWDCVECEMCGEPWCEICEEHYADCQCPGPHQDDVMEYRMIDELEYAAPIDEEESYGTHPKAQ